MSLERNEEPTPAEWKVLKVVWDRGPCPASEVVAHAGVEAGWSTSTVKTLLRRLVEKGHLRTKRVGTSFLYSPAGSPLRSLRRAGDELLARASESAVGPLLAHLVKRSRLSPDELRELRALIDSKAREDEKNEENER